MLAVSGKKWKEISVNKRIIEKLKIDHNFSEVQSKIIISREFNKIEINSLSKNIEIVNPFLKKKDFLEGKSILIEAIKRNNKILIIGDYDVDGCVSTSLFVNFFNSINKNVDYFIPNRFNDGYGANLNLIKKLIKKKTKFSYNVRLRFKFI